MFSKTNNNDRSGEQVAQAERVEPVRTDLQREEDRTRSCSYVGPNLFIKGEITADESLSIEGHIEGTIKSTGKKRVTVGKRGRVHADIEASIVEVRGKVAGDIRCDDVVHLYATGTVSGSIDCERLVVDDGAVFSGQINMRREGAKEQPKGKLVLASTNEDDDVLRNVGH